MDKLREALGPELPFRTMTESGALIRRAARKYLEVLETCEQEWICYYSELHDDQCILQHEPSRAAQPRKHTSCGWFVAVPLVLVSE